MDAQLPQTAWILLWTVIAFISGVGFFAIAVSFVPRWLDRLTPQIDETKEILNGNQAVAIYFGKIVSAVIIGLSIIIAAAIIAGIHDI